MVHRDIHSPHLRLGFSPEGLENPTLDTGGCRDRRDLAPGNAHRDGGAIRGLHDLPELVNHLPDGFVHRAAVRVRGEARAAALSIRNGRSRRTGGNCPPGVATYSFPFMTLDYGYPMETLVIPSTAVTFVYAVFTSLIYQERRCQGLRHRAIRSPKYSVRLHRPNGYLLHVDRSIRTLDTALRGPRGHSDGRMPDRTLDCIRAYTKDDPSS